VISSSTTIMIISRAVSGGPTPRWLLLPYEQRHGPITAATLSLVWHETNVRIAYPRLPRTFPSPRRQACLEDRSLPDRLHHKDYCIHSSFAQA
jgi:hypothetical protein